MLNEELQKYLDSYENRMYETVEKTTPCPYCGLERIVIHSYNPSYDREHEYRIEHIDEREACTKGCYSMYYAFDSAEKAIKHANMRDGRFEEKDI